MSTVREIRDGLYVYEGESMPCGPRDFGIGRWILPGHFERAEREEAAARILAHSQELNEWVGVSWSKLIEVMREELEAQKSLREARDRNFEARKQHRSLMKTYLVLSVLTLGIYAIFAKKPSISLVEEPKVDVPFSLVFMQGPQFVANGIHELVERGLLKLVEIGEGEDQKAIFFPQPAMIQRILEVQTR